MGTDEPQIDVARHYSDLAIRHRDSSKRRLKRAMKLIVVRIFQLFVVMVSPVLGAGVTVGVLALALGYSWDKSAAIVQCTAAG